MEQNISETTVSEVKKDCGFVKFNHLYASLSHTFFLLNLDVFFLLKKSHVTFLGLFSLAQLKLSWMSTISCIVSFKKHLIVFLTNSREKRKTHNKIKPIIT